MGWLARFLDRKYPPLTPPGEPAVSRADLDEISRRLKSLERALDDLHASYRRLRGHVGAVKQHDAPVEPDEPKPMDRRAALRARAAAIVRSHRGIPESSGSQS